MSKKPETINLPYDVILTTPVEYGSETTKKITFKNRLQAYMMKDIPMSQKMELTPGALYPVIAEMTGEFIEVIEKMDWCDALTCINVVTSFLGNGPTAGNTK